MKTCEFLLHFIGYLGRHPPGGLHKGFNFFAPFIFIFWLRAFVSLQRFDKVVAAGPGEGDEKESELVDADLDDTEEVSLLKDVVVFAVAV